MLVLMYHQIIDPKLDHEIIVNKFKQHLKYLQQNFNIILPGQIGIKEKINICLTFDDAYADFYIYIFPILKELAIPVVLAIPVGFIKDHTTVDNGIRLSVEYPLGLDHNQAHKSPLCTWDEIRKMVATGLVYPASHSFMHNNLTKINFSEAFKEICTSKRAIWVKLEKITDVMVYPFGAQNKQIHEMAKNHYKYLMRIGNASNINWSQSMLYRINADKFWQRGKKISALNILWWKIMYFFNKIRGK